MSDTQWKKLITIEGSSHSNGSDQQYRTRFPIYQDKKDQIPLYNPPNLQNNREYFLKQEPELNNQFQNQRQKIFSKDNIGITKTRFIPFVDQKLLSLQQETYKQPLDAQNILIDNQSNQQLASMQYEKLNQQNSEERSLTPTRFRLSVQRQNIMKEEKNLTQSIPESSKNEYQMIQVLKNNEELSLQAAKTLGKDSKQQSLNSAEKKIIIIGRQTQSSFIPPKSKALGEYSKKVSIVKLEKGDFGTSSGQTSQLLVQPNTIWRHQDEYSQLETIVEQQQYSEIKFPKEEEQQPKISEQFDQPIIQQNRIPNNFPPKEKEISVIKFPKEEEQPKVSERFDQPLVQQNRIPNKLPPKEKEISVIKFEDDEKQYQSNQFDKNHVTSVRLEDSSNSIDKTLDQPTKISNYVTINTSVQGEQVLSNCSGQLKIATSRNTIEIAVLEEMNNQRKQRVHGMSILFFSPLTQLEKSDCLDDLKAKEIQRRLLLSQFPYIRTVRGDGNCLFSSLVFPYLECIFINKEFDIVLNNLVVHEIIWNKYDIILIEKLAASTQIKTILRQLKQLSEMPNMDLMTYSQVIFHYMNNVNGFYDLMIIFMRSLIIESFIRYSKVEPYCDFFDEDSTLDFLIHQKTFEMEGDFQSICFFSELTEIQVKLVNFSDDDPIRGMQSVISKKKKSLKKKEGFISLKYHNGHYDILYSQMLKQVRILEVQLKLHQLQFNGLY